MKKVFVVALIVVFALAASVVPAIAHESRDVDDGINIAFGWRTEPAFSGLLNGPEVFITYTDEAAAADSEALRTALGEMEVELQAEVSFGGETTTVTFVPAFPAYEVYDGVGYAHYVADLIPMAAGDYEFRVTGTIGETEVDEVFTSADGEFSTIAPLTDVQFPSSLSGDIAALLERIAELEARIAELEAAGN